MYDEVLELLAVPDGQADAAQQHKLQEVWLGKARACQLLGRVEDAEAAFKASLDEGEEEGISGPGEAWRRRGAMEAHAALASIESTRSGAEYARSATRKPCSLFLHSCFHERKAIK